MKFVQPTRHVHVHARKTTEHRRIQPTSNQDIYHTRPLHSYPPEGERRSRTTARNPPPTTSHFVGWWRCHRRPETALALQTTPGGPSRSYRVLPLCVTLDRPSSHTTRDSGGRWCKVHCAEMRRAPIQIQYGDDISGSGLRRANNAKTMLYAGLGCGRRSRAGAIAAR